MYEIINKNRKLVEFTKVDNLDDALNLQKQIKGHHEYEGYCIDNYDFASEEYGFMVTNDGDIFYVYDTNEANRSFGEKLLHKVSATKCLHNGSFYWCVIDKTDNRICFASVPLKRDNNTRKASVDSNFILTTERVA
tara:strand:+ start:50 stop:457 length:408 start_codon:yes stop_codon:yes gene_type:complete